MEYRILGQVELWRHGQSVTLTGRKPRTILALLVLNAGHTVPFERIARMVWGQRVPRSGRRIAQQYISLLRGLLPGGALVTHHAGYCLHANSSAIDVTVFARTAALGRVALTNGQIGHASQLLHGALAQWRGPALCGVSAELLSSAGPPLEEQRLATIVDRVEADLRLGRHAELIAELADLVNQHPFHEMLRCQQMVALYRLGRRADALGAFHDCRRVLMGELGIDPGPQVNRLHHRLLADHPALMRNDPYWTGVGGLASDAGG